MLDVVTSVFRIAIGLVFMAVAVAIFAVACLVCFPSRRIRIRLCNVFGHIAGRVVLFLAGASVPPGLKDRINPLHPAIYVSNHTATIDIFLGVWLGPMGTVGMAKKEVVWYPFFGQLYAISGHPIIDRQNHQNALAAFKDAADLVKRDPGIGIWIWPEGTRSSDGRLRPFKKGFAHLALATGLPIVPVVVSGAHRSWRKNSLVLSPTKLGVQILDPIPTKDWKLETLDAHVAEVWARFAEALPDDQKPLVEAPKKAANA
jgi:1-acyl-sn-glycerol-3-phosphate acyltransferase